MEQVNINIKVMWLLLLLNTVNIVAVVVNQADHIQEVMNALNINHKKIRSILSIEDTHRETNITQEEIPSLRRVSHLRTHLIKANSISILK